MELQDRVEELREQGLGVAAISYDSEEVLADFSQRRGITFPLLSDDDSEVIKAFGILNTILMAVLERKREFGVVLALGLRPRRIFRIVYLESLMLAVLAAVLYTFCHTFVTTVVDGTIASILGLVLMLVVLVIRPEGLMGTRQRV